MEKVGPLTNHRGGHPPLQRLPSGYNFSTQLAWLQGGHPSLEVARWPGTTNHTGNRPGPWSRKALWDVEVLEGARTF